MANQQTDPGAAAGLEPCAAGAAPPVLHIRGDALGLMLEVVAAARAWRRSPVWTNSPHVDLIRAVDAYEAALATDATQ